MLSPRSFPINIVRRFGLAVLLLLLLAAPRVLFAQTAAVDPHFFDYDAHAPFAAVETPQPDVAGIKVIKVTFPSPVVTPFPVNNTVTGYLFLPSGPGPHPAMIVEHEWIPTNLNLEYTLCSGIARARIAAFLIIQPASVNRRPPGRTPDSELLSANVPHMVGGLRQAVLDARRAFDYLQKRPDIDPARMGISGISLGGILAPLIAGADKRAGVLLTFVGGADVADIVWDDLQTRPIRLELDKRGYFYTKFKREMAPIDPANWLSGFNPENALLINGRYDIFVQPKQARRLARALGGARIVWSNTGHYGLGFRLDEVQKIGTAFLQSRFFPGEFPPFVAPNTVASRTVKFGLLFGGREGASPALAYQLVSFDPQARNSLDAQLTLHGLSLALSARLNEQTAIGVELPKFRESVLFRPYILFHITL